MLTDDSECLEMAANITTLIELVPFFTGDVLLTLTEKMIIFNEIISENGNQTFHVMHNLYIIITLECLKHSLILAFLQ